MAYILIADDDEMIAEVASGVMMGQGHGCGWVTNGVEAWHLLGWRRPDLLLLDQDMPGMSGTQLLRKIRSSERLYDLPVMMFTALTGAEDEERAFYSGAQDYIRKPFDPKFLIWRINQVLRARAERPKHTELKEFLAQNSGQLQAETSYSRSIL